MILPPLSQSRYSTMTALSKIASPLSRISAGTFPSGFWLLSESSALLVSATEMSIRSSRPSRAAAIRTLRTKGEAREARRTSMKFPRVAWAAARRRQRAAVVARSEPPYKGAEQEAVLVTRGGFPRLCSPRLERGRRGQRMRSATAPPRAPGLPRHIGGCVAYVPCRARARRHHRFRAGRLYGGDLCGARHAEAVAALGLRARRAIDDHDRRRELSRLRRADSGAMADGADARASRKCRRAGRRRIRRRARPQAAPVRHPLRQRPGHRRGRHYPRHGRQGKMARAAE